MDCTLLRRSATAFLAILLLPSLAWAQATIVGVVKDPSGGVLPGVTVEAASPALIEGIRATTTDDQGRYRFEALRPGPYVLKFSLTGFDTLNRTGVDVPSDMIVTVNADMTVGTLAETLTVTGQALAGRRLAGVADPGADARHHRHAAGVAQRDVDRRARAGSAAGHA